MSQVKNLRAMFEQKEDTSPPTDRGRSPGIPSSGTDSPRPLSTIRTSFIAIEKDGRIGLQRDTSRDSSVSTSRKVSGDTDITSAPGLPEKTGSLEKTDKPEKTIKTSLKEQPIPESPRTETPSLPAAQVVHKKVQPSGDKTEATKSTPDAPSSQKAKGAANGTGVAKLPNEGVNGATSTKDKGRSKEVSKEATKATVKASTATTVASKPAPKAAPISITKTATAKPAKSPTVAKAPKSPVATAPKLPTKTPEKDALHPEKSATPRATPSASKGGISTTATKRPPQLQHPSGIGFVKPKVKSPTRPVKLPPGLTTHTAASGSKVNVPRSSPSRASGSLHPTDSLGRSPSRLSVSTVATNTTNVVGSGGKTLKRQSSTISRPRPSLGPPPKPKAKDHPPTKKEKEVDEGFLARMMRPTQASSSKTSDKVPTTPPRKAAPSRATPKSEAKRLPKAGSQASDPPALILPRADKVSVNAAKETDPSPSSVKDEQTQALTQENNQIPGKGPGKPHAETFQEVSVSAEPAKSVEDGVHAAVVQEEAGLPEEPSQNGEEPTPLPDVNGGHTDDAELEAAEVPNSSLSNEDIGHGGDAEVGINVEMESY